MEVAPVAAGILDLAQDDVSLILLTVDLRSDDELLARRLTG